MVRLRPLPAAADDPPAGADDPHAVSATGKAAAIATAASSRLVFMLGGSFGDAPLGIHCGPGGVGAPPGSGGVGAPPASGEQRLQRTSILVALASNRFDIGLAKSVSKGPG